MFLIEYKVVIMEIVSTLFFSSFVVYVVCCLCCSFVVYDVASLYVNTHSFIFVWAPNEKTMQLMFL